jgi:N-methylhydantoinase A
MSEAMLPTPNAGASSKTRVRVGIDTGGTFTDAVVVEHTANGSTGSVVAVRKIPSTPHSPADAPAAGLRALLAERSHAEDDYVEVCHATTVATNAVIERKGAKTCVIVTKGFRDLLEIGRFHRDRDQLYDLRYVGPEPIVPRSAIFELDERVLYDGTIDTVLADSEVDRIVSAIADGGFQSVAICLLFSFVNPAHEVQVVEAIHARCPGVQAAASHVVLPEIREYERAATTTISAYVGPVIQKYVDVLTAEANADGVTSLPHVMQSNGGLTSMHRTAQNAAGTLLSGPAAGVIGAAAVGASYGFDNLVTADMGGTSFDVGLVAEGEVLRTVDKKFVGYPIRLPMVDVEAIGAGGGSIAWLDAFGDLRVGPRSAGAVPGPACYGKGGTAATVTDADLYLGLLDPKSFLGGDFTLYADKAAAVLTTLGDSLGMTAGEAAKAIHDLVVVNMAGAIRLVTIQRGLDAREFTLVPFGGAGPTHAAAIARELGMSRVLVPRFPGVMSAVGLCCADVKYDYVDTIGKPAREITDAQLTQRVTQLVSRGVAELEEDGFGPDDRIFNITIECRYTGQGFVIDVPLEHPSSELDMDSIVQQFHKMHGELHGFAVETEGVEVLAVRVAATGRLGFKELALGMPGSSGTAAVRYRRVHMPWAEDFEEVAVHDRLSLKPGDVLQGPVVIEQQDTTTIVPRGCTVTVLEHGDLELNVPNEEGAE